MTGRVSVALLSLLVYGCATHPVTVEIEPRSADPRGHISTRPGRPGLVVAAPHGTSDPLTGEIAAEIARRTGFGLVVATGFTVEMAADDRAVRRYQVNRPSEGRPGFGPVHDEPTPAARRIYDEYERRVREAARGPLMFFVEIHGNGRAENADRVEIATTGVDAEHALRLKTLLELTRDAHLRTYPAAPRLQILVEPADIVFYAAGGAKRDGILRLAQRALHVELPRAARRDFRDLYTAVLADFVAEAAALSARR